MNSRKKGFTLIELIAVLVILAILALIVTPLVMNIIRKAKVSADKRSVDAYGRSVELAIATHLLDTGAFPTDLKNLNVEYTGKTVSCNVMQMKENGGIYLSECSVGTKAVKDSSTEDGWYHYGTRDITNEEYVDMYGLALKTASVAYYNENGNPVEDYTTLTIDYKGKSVACDVTVNYDGSIYMTKCKVNNVDVTDDTEDGYYHYGAITFRPYNIGDQVSYNNVDYYVIKDTDSNVTLLKAKPLTVAEVNTYLTSTGVGGTANDVNGYGGTAYGYSNDYATSNIKKVVDAWAQDTTNFSDLVVDSTGYSARLLSHDELINDLGYVNSLDTKLTKPSSNGTTPEFVFNMQYWYWTMSKYDNNSVWNVNADGHLGYYFVLTYTGVVRPVITISKSSI